MRYNLYTQQDICNKANKIDYGLNHKENRFNFLFAWTEKIKGFFVKLKF